VTLLTTAGKVGEHAKLRKQARDLERDIDRKLNAHEVGRPLTTIQGIAPLTAACIIGETGDPARFRSAAALASYVGLVPRLHQSEERRFSGLRIAYRAAGDTANPKLVLLHGFPASSHQYRNLIPSLSDRFHVIAPDYLGFGDSEMPDPTKYAYSFDKISRSRELSAAEGFRPLWVVRPGLRRPSWFQDRGSPSGLA
jgi:Transposase IS116/IS110/IS902 family/alpha/beta hydrolase fold